MTKSEELAYEKGCHGPEQKVDTADLILKLSRAYGPSFLPYKADSCLREAYNVPTEREIALKELGLNRIDEGLEYLKI